MLFRHQLTLLSKFSCIHLFFNFQIIRCTLDSFSTTLFSFLLSTSATSSRCCNPHGITFTSFKCFLFSLLTKMKSILDSLSPDLNAVFLLSVFLNHVFAINNYLSSQNSSSILPSAILLPITIKPFYLFTNMSTKISQSEYHFTRILTRIRQPILHRTCASLQGASLLVVHTLILLVSLAFQTLTQPP